jgi:signal transduction histidine kinase
MKEMIMHFLDTVSLEDLSSREKSFQNIEIIHLIQSVIAEYRTRANEKDIKINLNFNPELITILVDHNFMVQVMENLLSNAIKFSSNNSVINVRIKVHFEDETEVLPKGWTVKVVKESGLCSN